MSDDPHPSEAPAPPAGGRVRRRVLRFAGRAGLVALVIILALSGGLWLRLLAGPITLPQSVTERIETGIDARMGGSALSLGAVELDRAPGGIGPVLTFRDVALTDETGAPRAAFPALRVAVAPAPVLRGKLRPRRIDILGAGLRLSRDAEGRLDLNLAADPDAPDVTLAETMARLDAMVSQPAFGALQEISASGIDVALADEGTGRVIRLDRAEARLGRRDGALVLDLGGGLLGAREGRVDITLTRSAALARTSLDVTVSGLAARDVAAATPALGWLDLLRAPISGNLSGALDDTGALGPFHGTLSLGAGTLALAPEAAQEDDTLRTPFDALTLALSYTPETGRLDVSDLRLDAPALRVSGQGHADVDQRGRRFTGQFRLAGIEAALPGVLEAPVSVEGAVLDMRLTLGAEPLLEIGQAAIFDGDLRASARGRLQATAEGLSGGLDAQLVRADMPSLLAYWPPAAAPRTRTWVAENLLAGEMEGMEFALRLHPGEAVTRFLQFDFDGADVAAVPGAPPIEDGRGYLQIHGQRMVLRLDAGEIVVPQAGRLSLAGSTMVMPDTRRRDPDALPRGSEAQFDLGVSGDLQALMQVLSGPPLRVLADGPMTPERLGQGEVSGRAVFTTRLRHPDPDAPQGADLGQTDVRVTAEVRDFSADALVPGRSLAAERLAVTLEPGLLQVSGRASFDGVPVTGSWQRAIGTGTDRSQVEARVPLSVAALERIGISLPQGLVAGEGQGDLSITLPDGAPPNLRLTSALEGVSLSLPQLGWSLPAPASGRLVTEVALGPDPQVTALEIEAGGLTLDGSIALEAGRFARLDATRFRIGAWLDVAGSLTARGAGEAPAIAVTSGILDMRQAPPMGGGAGDGGGPLDVALDRLQLSDTIALTGLRAELTTAGGLQGPFRGAVNETAAVSGVLVPAEDGVTIRLQSDDGGAVLAAAGIYRNLYGGPLDLILRPLPAPGSYRGRLSVDGPRLRNAPAMAELLNAVSVVGLIDQLGGEGINLGQVEARFTLTPTRITLTEGSAVGPSLGLSIDGVYDILSRRVDMQGVISPLYMVNGVLGALFAPRREGLFGFSYRLTGTADDTNVAVNPLSILTPGIFRDIFRAPPPAPPP